MGWCVKRPRTGDDADDRPRTSLGNRTVLCTELDAVADSGRGRLDRSAFPVVLRPGGCVWLSGMQGGLITSVRVGDR